MEWLHWPNPYLKQPGVLVVQKKRLSDGTSRSIVDSVSEKCPTKQNGIQPRILSDNEEVFSVFAQLLKIKREH